MDHVQLLRKIVLKQMVVYMIGLTMVLLIVMLHGKALPLTVQL